jgi:hypothetical protein
MKVEAISELLAERCPSFFSEADKVCYQALELLNRAKITGNPEERERYLKNSLDVGSDSLSYTFDYHQDITEFFLTSFLNICNNRCSFVFLTTSTNMTF